MTNISDVIYMQIFISIWYTLTHKYMTYTYTYMTYILIYFSGGFTCVYASYVHTNICVYKHHTFGYIYIHTYTDRLSEVNIHTHTSLCMHTYVVLCMPQQLMKIIMSYKSIPCKVQLKKIRHLYTGELKIEGGTFSFSSTFKRLLCENETKFVLLC